MAAFNWWDVSNQSPMAYQPNTQFAMPSWDQGQNQMPVSQNLMPVAPNPITSGGTPPVNGLGNLWGALGSTNEAGIRTDGWGGMALGAAQGISGAFMGMQQYNLAKKTLAENKKQFNLNFNTQRTLTNGQLEDRQRARVASNAGAYQSVGDYMQKNGV